MERLELSLGNLGELEQGAFGPEVDLVMRQVIDHIYRYSGLNASRKVTIELEFKPVFNNKGLMEGVQVTPSVIGKVPKSKGLGQFIAVRRTAAGQIEAFITADRQGGLFEGETEGGN